MPRFRVKGSFEYCKSTDAYLDSVVEAEDEDKAIEEALVAEFGGRGKLARFMVNDYFDTEEVSDDFELPEGSEEQDV